MRQDEGLFRTAKQCQRIGFQHREPHVRRSTLQPDFSPHLTMSDLACHDGRDETDESPTCPSFVDPGEHARLQPLRKRGPWASKQTCMHACMRAP